MKKADNVIKRQASIGARRAMRRARKYLLLGVAVTAPAAITIYLAYLFIHFMDQQVARLLPNSLQPPYGESIFPGSGFVIAGIFLVLVGWLASNVLGRACVRWADYLMNRLPGLRTIYSTVKQVFETLLGSQANAFREVVLVEYPQKGAWTIAFISGTPSPEIAGAVGGDEILNVFIPTVPGVISGFLVFVPRKDVIPLKMSVEEGLKLVVSMGMLSKEPEKKKAA